MWVRVRFGGVLEPGHYCQMNFYCEVFFYCVFTAKYSSRTSGTLSVSVCPSVRLSIHPPTPAGLAVPNDLSCCVYAHVRVADAFAASSYNSSSVISRL